MSTIRTWPPVGPRKPPRAAPRRRSPAYYEGVRARASEHPEPKSGYNSGSQDYVDFACGFCATPFPDSLTTSPQAMRAMRASNGE